MATRSPKREKNWPAICGVSAISGTMQQRAAALRQRGLDGGQIDFGLARPGDAVQQKGLEAPGLDGVVNLLEGGLLRGIQLVPRADRGLHGDGLRLERDDAFARQRARGRAGVLHRVFQFLQIVRAGMQFQKGAQFPLGLVELGLGALAGADEFDAQALGGRAQRIALRLHLFGDDEALALQRADRLIGQRHGFGEIGGRERALLEHAQDLQYGIVGRGIEQELARGIAAGIGQGPDLCRGGFRRRGAACRAAHRPAASSSSRRSSGPAPAVRRSSTGSVSIRRSASRVATSGGSSWQRRMTPVSLRVPKGTIRRLPARTRCRSVSGSE